MTPESKNTRHPDLRWKHGYAPRKGRNSTYTTWRNMIERTANSKVPAYKNYGGRGISVCERWRHSFPNFLADMGECPPGLTIDRINNDGNYEPGNCRWATRKQQQANKRPKPLIDLTGQRFSRWLVLGLSHRDHHGIAYWFCRCDCGTEKVVSHASLHFSSRDCILCAHLGRPRSRKGQFLPKTKP